MSAPVIRLGSRHKSLLHSGFMLLWLSGALWLLFHHFLQVEGEFGPARHPLETWWLRLHGLMAMLALVLLGSLAPNHIRLAWSRRRNLATGLSMFAFTLWLAGTGYALYYFSSDANADWLPILHWAVGLALPAGLIVHVRHGRKPAANRHRRAPSGHGAPATSRPAHQQAASWPPVPRRSRTPCQ